MTFHCALSTRSLPSTISASERWRARLPPCSAASCAAKPLPCWASLSKPDTDDMREAPSILLVTGLLDMGAKVRAFDPAGMTQARHELPEIDYCDDAYAGANDADALVIVTEWV